MMASKDHPRRRATDVVKLAATGWSAVALELLRSEKSLCGAALLVSLATAACLMIHISGGSVHLPGVSIEAKAESAPTKAICDPSMGCVPK